MNLPLSTERLDLKLVQVEDLPDIHKLHVLPETGFDHLKLHRIEAGCAVANTGSVKVLEKAGMLKEGRKRKVLPLKEGWSDNYEFAMLEEDWENRRNGKQAIKQ